MSTQSLLAETAVVILAGGLGTRLRPVCSDRPKGLAPIGGRPFLQIQIECLRDQGARRFVLCVGHQADQIQDYFQDGAHLGTAIDYSREHRLLGTAGALRLAEKFIAPCALVLNGDTYLAADYERLLQHHWQEHSQSGVLATLTLARLEDASRYGTVLLDATNRFVAGFREKSADPDAASSWLNAGAYVIERRLLDLVPPDTVCSLEREVFPATLAASLPLAAWLCGEAFHDIGTPESLSRFIERYEGN